MVEGASPELLRELLNEYEELIRDRTPDDWNTAQPGLRRIEIVEFLASIGLVPPDEIIVWWEWQGGHATGRPYSIRHPHLTLDSAKSVRETSGVGFGEFEWNPSWLPVAGEGPKFNIAVDCSGDHTPPLVRAISPEEASTTHDVDSVFQVVSLCTPVAWWIEAIRQGWYFVDENQNWQLRWAELPPEWKRTLLV